MIHEKSERYRQYICSNIHKSNAELARDLGITIDAVRYQVKRAGLIGVRKRGAPIKDQYDDYIITHYQTESAGIIASNLGLSIPVVRSIIKRLKLSRLPDQTILHKPYPIKENLVGQRFGRLVVQRQIGTNQYGQMRYECLCDCGKITYAVAGNLKHGAKTSCGCAPRGKKAKALGGLVKPDKNK